MSKFVYRLSTYRYMAPEVLSDSMDVTCFQSFKCSDVYSFSLIIWEIIRRTRDVDVKVLSIGGRDLLWLGPFVVGTICGRDHLWYRDHM